MELATRQNEIIKSFGQLLEARKGEIAKVLPKHVTPERILKVAVQSAARNPVLLECTPTSFYASVLAASELGLEPGGPMARAHLVPFRNNKTGKMECQMIPDYRGLIDLARRSGLVKELYAFAVHEGDEFDFELGLDMKLKHKPAADAKTNVTHVYAVAHFNDGGRQFHVLTRAQVEQYRARSKSKDRGPWCTDWEAMALKTVIKRLCNLLPQSVEMAKALEADAVDEIDRKLPQVAEINVTHTAEIPALPQTKTEEIKDVLKKRGRPAKVAAPPPPAILDNPPARPDLDEPFNQPADPTDVPQSAIDAAEGLGGEEGPPPQEAVEEGAEKLEITAQVQKKWEFLNIAQKKEITKELGIVGNKAFKDLALETLQAMLQLATEAAG